jgi:hypothetical protein
VRALGTVELVGREIRARLGRVGRGVRDLCGLSNPTGVDGVGEVDDKGGRCGEEDVAVGFCLLAWGFGRDGGRGNYIPVLGAEIEGHHCCGRGLKGGFWAIE